MGTAEEFLESYVSRYVNIAHSGRFRLIHSTESRSENASLELSAHGVADVEVGIVFKEELVEDFVAVVLVLVASTHHAVGPHDSSAQSLATILLEDGLELQATEHLITLTDKLELRLVHAHVLRVLHRVVLQRQLFESEHSQGGVAYAVSISGSVALRFKCRISK